MTCSPKRSAPSSGSLRSLPVAGRSKRRKRLAPIVQGCKPLDVLELLAHLVNKSLVAVDEQEGEARYHLLETIRQYAP